MYVRPISNIDCDEDNQKSCEARDTSNNCEKIKGNDTCLCGRDPECDFNGQKPKCVNSYGHSEPMDTSLTCKASKMSHFIDRFKSYKSSKRI